MVNISDETKLDKQFLEAAYWGFIGRFTVGSCVLRLNGKLVIGHLRRIMVREDCVLICEHINWRADDSTSLLKNETCEPGFILKFVSINQIVFGNSFWQPCHSTTKNVIWSSKTRLLEKAAEVAPDW